MLSFAGTALAEEALDRQITIDIRANTPLEDALIDWGTLSGLTVMINTATVHGHLAPAVQGNLTARAALTAILKDSGLSYTEQGGRVHVVLTSALMPSALVGGAETILWASSSDFPPQANNGTDDERPNDSSKGNNGKDNLTEVIVTAQKRTERLQDVPVAVTAISSEALIDSNQLRLQEYFSRVPGLSVSPDDFGTPAITIRGITSGGFQNPTVAVVIDDLPYGSSTAIGGGNTAPDIDPGDLARVEVLRGPQGTLYGASSLGGLLKFVTVDPSTDGISGHVRVGSSSVYNGDKLGYNVSGSINVPITDSLAVVASGFSRQDPGYIDNPALNSKGVNEGDVDGGRISALWRESPDFSLKLNAILQDTTIHGSSLAFIQPGLGDLQQIGVLRGYGGYRRSLQSYSGVLDANLGLFKLTSITGYNTNSYYDSADYGIQGGYTANDHFTTDKFTQEIRLSTEFGSKVDWLMGLFYTHEKTGGTTWYVALDPTTAALGGNLYQGSYPTTFSEYAAFTDFTFHLTDRFDVQIGGRESKNDQDYSSVASGPLAGVGIQITPDTHSEDSAFTYLVTPSFKISPDEMLYARLASGYRPGGPNTDAGLGLPLTYGADKTSDYDIGAKGDIVHRILSYDASIYYIDWKDIQVNIIDPNSGVGYFANAGRAKSEGVELSLESRPLKGLSIATWVSWDEAALTVGFPTDSQAYGVPGNRLPNSARWSGNFSIDQELFVTGRIIPSVGVDLSYVGDRIGLFTGNAQRQELPAYFKTDLRAAIKYESWAFNLFANNITDRRGILNGGLGTNNPTAFQYIQPRTAGLLVSKSF